MTTKLRRSAWVALGVVAVPAAFLGTLLLVTPFWVVAIVATVALVMARWRMFDHLITALAVGVLLPAGLIDRAHQAANRYHSPGEWLIRWSLLWISITALTVCAAKLGRKAGHAAWEH